MQNEPQGSGVPPEIDTGLAYLDMQAHFHNIAAPAEQLTYELAEEGRRFDRAELMLAAKTLGSRLNLYVAL